MKEQVSRGKLRGVSELAKDRTPSKVCSCTELFEQFLRQAHY